MSNRQARREQARTSRATRTQRPAPRGQQRKSSSGGGPDIFSRGFLLVLAGFVAIAAVVVVLVVLFGGSDGKSSDWATLLENHRNEIPADLVNGTKLGKDTAPVKITEYEDFQCPFCLEFTSTEEPDIVNQLVKTGRVQLEYRNLAILGPESVSAAVAAQCAADQNKFWLYQNALFTIQAKAGQFENEKKNVGRFADAKLKQVASDVGLDRSKFDQCLDSRTHLDVVNDQQREANSFGIQGTPGFLVNGQPLTSGAPQGIESWTSLVESVESAIATATAGGNASPTASTSPGTTGTPAATTSPAPTATKAP